MAGHKDLIFACLPITIGAAGHGNCRLICGLGRIADSARVSDDGVKREMMNVKDVKKAKCEYCGGLFVVAQAVVLNEKGEFHYFCSKDVP